MNLLKVAQANKLGIKEDKSSNSEVRLERKSRDQEETEDSKKEFEKEHPNLML